MALVCDYCGDVTESSERVSVAFGHNQEIALKGATAHKWFYYCEGNCADSVRAMLDNLALFALHGEGSGLMWQLVQQERAPKPKEGSVKPKVAAKDDELAPIDLSTPEALKPKAEQSKEEEAELAKQERAARLNLSWYLKGDRPDPREWRERHAKGTPITSCVAHQGSRGNLYGAGVVTLEDAAAMTEVEFAGLHGVGAVILGHVKRGLKKHRMEFAPGPDAEQVGVVLKARREEAGVSVEDLAVTVATGLGAPESYPTRDCRSSAVHDADSAIRNAERGSKPLAPQALDIVCEVFDLTRAELLDQAAEAEIPH